ncbi:hypothetical protein LINPERPRIM_LOCUS25089 [Linum perenne]
MGHMSRSVLEYKISLGIGIEREMFLLTFLVSAILLVNSYTV